MKSRVTLATFLISALLATWAPNALAEGVLKALEEELQNLARDVHPTLVRVILPSLPQAEEKTGPGQPLRQKPTEEVLGVILEDGYILTSDIAGSRMGARVGFPNGKVSDAAIIGADKETGIGLLRVETKERSAATDLKSAPVALEARLSQGSIVALFSGPTGLFDTMVLGVVAADPREIGAETFIQVSAPSNCFTDFSPVFNVRGELVGIVDSVCSASSGPRGGVRLILRSSRARPPDEEYAVDSGHPSQASPEQALEKAAEAVRKAGRLSEEFLDKYGPMIQAFGARSGTEGGGIVFVRPIDDVLCTVEALKKGELKRVYLGIVIKGVTDDLRAQIPALGERQGVFIVRVLPGTHAERAGLKEGDVVVEIDGESVKGASHLRRKVQSAEGKLALGIIRDGKEVKLEVQLGEK